MAPAMTCAAQYYTRPLQHNDCDSAVDTSTTKEIRKHLQRLHHGKLDVYGLSTMPLPRLQDTMVAVEHHRRLNPAMVERAMRGEKPKITTARCRPTLSSSFPVADTACHGAMTIILQATSAYEHVLPRDMMHQAMQTLSNHGGEPPHWLSGIIFQLMMPATRTIYEGSIGAPWWNWFKYLADDPCCIAAEIEDMFDQGIDSMKLWPEMKAILRTLRTSNCFTNWEDVIKVWIHLSICRHMAMCLETHNFRWLERAFFKKNQVVFRAIEAGQEAPDWQRQMVKRHPGRVRLSYDGAPLHLEGIVHISSCGSFVVLQEEED